MNRILIFRGGAVGDFIVTLPVFAALRRQWPKARITLISYPRVKRLALEYGLADEFHSLDSPDMARLFAEKEELNRRPQRPQRKKTPLRDIRDLLLEIPSFDLVISYLHDPDDVVRANLELAGARQLICATPLPKAGHVVDHLLEPLAERGVPVSGNQVPSLKPDQRSGRARPPDAPRSCTAASSAAGGSSGPALPIFLHPGSGSPKKNWPAAKFAELARQIRVDKLGSPFFTLGEADDAVGEALARLAPDVPVVRDLDLADLAMRLAGCRAYVGNDSGITHLAAATGIPVVALFGPTDPAIWGPRGPNVRIIRAAKPSTRSLVQIETREVLEIMKKLSQPRGPSIRKKS